MSITNSNNKRLSTEDNQPRDVKKAKPLLSLTSFADFDDDLFGPLPLSSTSSNPTSSSSMFSQDESNTNPPAMVGFSTGRNQKINISKEKMKLANDSFKSLDDDDEPPMKIPATVGFSTGHNKKIAISKEKMKLANDSFKALDDVKVDSTPTTKVKPITTTQKPAPLVSKKSPPLPLSSPSKGSFKTPTKTNSPPISPTIDKTTTSTTPIKPFVYSFTKKHNFTSPVKTTTTNNNSNNLTPSKQSPSTTSSLIQSTPSKLPTPLKQSSPSSSTTSPSSSSKSHKKKLKDLGIPFSTSPIGLVKESILQLDKKKSEEYEFESNESSIQLGFKQKKIRVSDIYIHLLKSQSIQPKHLLTDEWVRIHFGAIVWKLATMERAFPLCYAGKYLTLTRVISQLESRFQKEIIQSKRSIIRKIYEKDDSSERFMILFISQIFEFNNNNNNNNDNDNDNSTDNNNSTTDITTNKPTTTDYKQTMIELSDGWYYIKCLLDPHLSLCLERKMMYVGQKLRIQGAKMIGNDNGISPLEEGSDKICLQIFANSTRRAKWFEKLGLVNKPNFSISLNSIIPGSGIISSLNIKILKKYSILYKEKTKDEIIIIRSKSEEDSIQNQYEKRVEQYYEKRYIELSNQYEKEERKDASSVKKCSLKELESIQDGDMLYAMFKSSNDDESFFNRLNHDQQSLLKKQIDNNQMDQRDRINREIKDEMDSNPLLSKRNVIPILKIKISNYNHQPNHNNNNQYNQPQINQNNVDYLTPKQIYENIDEIPLYLPSNNYSPSTLPNVKEMASGNGNTVYNPLPKITFQQQQPLQPDNLSLYETILTFNNPHQELIESLKEGRCYHLYNVSTAALYNHFQSNRKPSNNQIPQLKSITKTSIVEMPNQPSSNNNNNTSSGNGSGSSKSIYNTINHKSIHSFESIKLNNSINQEFDFVALLLYVGPKMIDNNKKRIEINRTLYIVDKSANIAKIQLYRIIWLNQDKEMDNNEKELYYLDISIPFQQGITFNQQSSQSTSYPIIYLSNLKYDGYDQNNQLLLFSSRDNNLEVSSKSKNNIQKEYSNDLINWLSLSPNLFNLFNNSIKPFIHHQPIGGVAAGGGGGHDDFQFDFDDDTTMTTATTTTNTNQDEKDPEPNSTPDIIIATQQTNNNHVISNLANIDFD